MIENKKVNIGKVTLRAGREKSLKLKHSWVFSRAIKKISSGVENGDLVEVMSENGDFLAFGYINLKNDIAVRALSFEPVEIKKADDLEDLLESNLKKALKLRKDLCADMDGKRLVYAEFDNLPGLVVDQYGKVLVVQISTLGMEKLKPRIIKLLEKLVKPDGIYERSDMASRKKEGLEQKSGVLTGHVDDLLQIEESGAKFWVDVKHGQKTGFFLDQRENRAEVAKHSKGKRVLNLFSYSGGFSIQALKAGAKEVVSVDLSESALNLLRENLKLNKLDEKNASIVAEDVFEYLENAIKNEEEFDIVIVDPPAFAKNLKDQEKALRAYSSLNKLALQVLAKNGVLFTASCSGVVNYDDFKKAIFHASIQADRELSLIYSGLQPIDHGVKLNFREGEYLKFLGLRAL